VTSHVIELARGAITAADELVVELVQPGAVRIIWPTQPTVVPPAHYAETAAAAMRLLANGSTELARLKAARKR
jgi:hypothetical protein